MLSLGALPRPISPVRGLCFLLLFVVYACGQVIASSEVSENLAHGLQVRQSGCSKDNPCVKPRACCNGVSGFCGFEPSHCGSECVADCDAKADCGQYADPPGTECPLRTCCSKHGFCGVAEDFCEDGCQSNCDEPPPKGQYDSDVRDQVVGYFAAWTLLKRGCSKRTIDHIRTDSLTHINVAFGFIRPDTYEIYPIRGASISSFQEITNLKQEAPGLKVWIALGGWTHNDNDTDTQPVFGDLSSSSTKRARFIDKLVRFMLEWGFDGVDLDWEYPGAPDRGGQDRDTENYVQLVKDIRTRFDAEGRGWGLSIAAPTSYWYLRWFDIGNMHPYLDWINLMTYDIHGSWDEDSDWIGPHVYAHTNMTEIKKGLGLLWRNGVPANKVQLGLAFYGRTYLLESSSCTTPGCKFDDPGRAGQCSGTPGYMSWQDLKYIKETWNPKITHDKKEMVKYFTYDKNQWVSYDDEETIQDKVKFANEMGLRGLFIWAIDQDDYDNSMLDAVLQPDGLGKFKKRNGVGGDGQDWTSVDMEGGCYWSSCGGDCPVRYIPIEEVRCHIRSDGTRPYKKLCCPMDHAPDPDTCHWRGTAFGGLWCEPGDVCPSGEQRVASSEYYKDGNKDVRCGGPGVASYCCELASGGPLKCEWNTDRCIKVDSTGKPQDDPQCPSGTKYITHRRGRCPSGRYEPFCCDTDVDSSSCRWRAHMFDKCNPTCQGNEISFGQHNEGGGHNCQYSVPGGGTFPGQPGAQATVFPRLCCDADDFDAKLKELPIPLENLFPDHDDIPESDEQSFEVEVDQTMGGKKKKTGDDHPDANSFGWHIMSGPEDQLISLTKRDGSHWRLYDCDREIHQGRQSARMVCIDETESSNCHKIFEGGVPTTIMEMPAHCGAGKYAIAVSMDQLPEEEAAASLPSHARRRLFKRGIEQPRVYNLTFDYDYSILQGRQDKQVRIRIDYSDIPGYWSQVVAAPPDRKRSVKREVQREHGGNWKRYVDHQFRKERRETPDDQLHEFEKRWFALALEDWLDRQHDAETDYDLVRHSVNQNFRWTLFDQDISCPRLDAHAELWASLNVNVETAAVATFIGSITNIANLQHTYVTFRNSGDVKFTFHFDANAELRFTTGPTEVVGIAPLGASFKIPGIVTIGPQFRMMAELNGRASINVNAHVGFNVMKWDFSQQYPLKDSNQGPIHNDKDEPDTEDPREGLAVRGKPQFGYDLRAEGMIEAIVTPIISFGIVFDSSLQVPNSAIDAGVDAYARMYASAGSSTEIAWEYCYGAEAGYSVFGRVSSPELFGMSLNRRWDLLSDTFDIIPRTCDDSDS
ncbi:glycoside hydrolase family 18 protein [Sodiomyces alcalophilus JCM 7366]|uniref:glycoside hydrolase family 18 protein n=1 Tax=Sodiomyces alcalophilus JCM 7366 TaxID=591952 RepID=UPI0039B63213